MKKQIVPILLILGLTLISFNQVNIVAADSSQIQEIDENFKIDYSGFHGNQLELNEAAYKEFKRADDKLNEIYNKIFIKYKDNQLFLDKLINAEIAWINFRDAQLEAIYPEENKSVYYGSIFPMVYNIEKAKLTWDRVIQLNQWLIEYPEGTTGLGSRGKQ